MKLHVFLFLLLIAPVFGLQSQTYIQLQVVAPDIPVATAGPDTSIDAGQSVILNVAVTGGTSPFTYQWMPTSGIGDPTSATPTASPTATTTYSVTVTDSNNCESTASVEVVILPVGIVPIAATHISIYPNPTDGQITIEGILVQEDGVWVDVFDTNGKSVLRFRASGSRHIMSLRNLHSGMYLVTIQLHHGQVNQILIIR